MHFQSSPFLLLLLLLLLYLTASLPQTNTPTNPQSSHSNPQQQSYGLSGQNQLCENNGWCTYQAIDSQSIIVLYCVMGVTVGIGIFAITYFSKLISILKNSNKKYLFSVSYLRVYYIVLAWIICVIIKTLINIAAFYIYMLQNQSEFEKPTKQSPVVVMSAIFYAFDSSSTFFILSLIIFIPYQWSHRFRFLLQHINQNQHLPLQSRKLYDKSFKVLKFLRIYMLARTVLLIWCLIESILLVQTKIGCQISQIDYGIIIGESIGIFGIYLFIFYVAESTKKYKLVNMAKKDYQRLKLQYSLLILALIARIVLNSFFNLFAGRVLEYIPGKNCSDLNHSPDNSIKRSIFLILGYTIMHFLPIILVLIIYKPNVDSRERDQRILKYQGTSDIGSDSDHSNISTINSGLNRKKLSESFT